METHTSARNENRKGLLDVKEMLILNSDKDCISYQGEKLFEMVECYNKGTVSIQEFQRFMKTSKVEAFGWQNKRKGNDTSLHFALRVADIKCVRELIKSTEPQYLEIKNGKGNIPLHLATEKDYVEVVKDLLEKGSSDCRKVKNTMGRNPLYVACQRGQIECVKELLKDSRPEFRELQGPVSKKKLR
eukprot:TRINITY_DN2916_c1_g2_i3.p1 TRINITY_DN2916_c1_g2~~TRINITY_DN2916_c1_g2_i3.p1  ORF type:complete len:187 (+),score=24.62 TRINITY_DN2916_c1_g2_i3:209-769(+)